MIERSTTLAGDTILYADDKNPTYELTINPGGIFLSDGKSEIAVEIGENGAEGNYQYITRIDELLDREVELIYHIAMYQYDSFIAECEYGESLEEGEYEEQY